jgi:hypothetical protein
MIQANASASPTPEHHKTRKRFSFAHSLAGVALLLGIEGALVGLFDVFFGTNSAGAFVVVIGALIGGLFVTLIATEVIEEVRKSIHMLFLLSAVVFEFIVFFAFQYWYLSLIIPGSFHSLPMDTISMLLQSTMVFAFNPLYMPATQSSQALLLVNTLESLVLAFFVLQNVWQFRRNTTES